MNKLNIWQISREMSPFAEAGGIKDVVAGLSESLARMGHDITVVLPMYKFLKHFKNSAPDLSFHLKFDDKKERIEIFQNKFHSIRILMISANCFENKDQIYTYSRDEELEDNSHVYGTGHLDSHKMNLMLQRCSLEIAFLLVEAPDIFHLHDGHTGFLPAIMKMNRKYLPFFANTSSLLTIHNAGIIYQQNIVSLEETLSLTGLPQPVLEGIHTEYGYSPILCAGKYGNINTVSENYSMEILNGTDINSGSLGKTLIQEKIELLGITNGIDTGKYKIPLFRHFRNPDFLDETMLWKQEYKELLFGKLKQIKLDNPVFGDLINDYTMPLVTMQSRITSQKGIDVFCDSLELLINRSNKINFLIIGEGEKIFEDRLSLIAQNKKNICYIKAYDESLSQHLFAAGDFFIIPSRWEPCGLTDFIAQLFGNIPIVHETGGLIKTKNKINGFSYKNNDGNTLAGKIEEAVSFYENNPSFLYDIRKNAVNLINEKYTWEKVITEGYLPYYRKISE